MISLFFCPKSKLCGNDGQRIGIGFWFKNKRPAQIDSHENQQLNNPIKIQTQLHPSAQKKANGKRYQTDNPRWHYIQQLSCPLISNIFGNQTNVNKIAKPIVQNNTYKKSFHTKLKQSTNHKDQSKSSFCKRP